MVIATYIICFFIVICYCTNITAYTAAIRFGRNRQKNGQTANPTITAVVVCHNEADNLQKLLHSLTTQSRLPDKIIVVDDHSSDDTIDIATKFAKMHGFIEVYRSSQRGKKAGIMTAVRRVTTDYILFTDGDCVIPKNHLQICHAYLATHNCDMLIGGVRPIVENTLWHKCQAIEYYSLQGSTMGAALLNHPIMCNGANLTARTADYKSLISEINTSEQSGDDMFMLHAFKRTGKQINYLDNPEYQVATKLSPNIKSFVRQRTRWSGKSVSYHDTDTIATALIVVAMNAILLATAITAPFTTHAAMLFLLLYTSKTAIDAALIYNYTRYAEKTRLTVTYYILYLLITPLYPIYCIVIGMTGIIKNIVNKSNQTTQIKSNQ